MIQLWARSNGAREKFALLWHAVSRCWRFFILLDKSADFQVLCRVTTRLFHVLRKNMVLEDGPNSRMTKQH